jgi:hypothetical protein
MLSVVLVSTVVCCHDYSGLMLDHKSAHPSAASLTSVITESRTRKTRTRLEEWGDTHFTTSYWVSDKGRKEHGETNVFG